VYSALVSAEFRCYQSGMEDDLSSVRCIVSLLRNQPRCQPFLSPRYHLLRMKQASDQSPGKAVM
jgi:hypothetical protein